MMSSSVAIAERLTEEELIQQTANKYDFRFWQKQGLFTCDRDGLYDSCWVEVWNEAQRYERAGFDEWGALCEATHDIVGYYPEGYEEE
jgi:hypothetical protein